MPRLRFLKIDGAGDPNVAPSYRNAVQWLYSASYGLKFASKAGGRDYGVAPLEGLWWSQDPTQFAQTPKSAWLWTMMIMQPDWIDGGMLAAAIEKAERKLGEVPETLRLEDCDEGLSVQIMHIGPYDAEAPTIARMHREFLPANGLVENGHHHEIYISDPTRTPPDKLKTVLRQPVRRS